MFLNIITPCSRPHNLEAISKSINIPSENYRWIVVFDSQSIPENVSENCEPYAIKVPDSRFGNAQRNYGIDLVKEGHIYFNDDDTTIVPVLWENIKDLTQHFISFSQIDKNGKLRLDGKTIVVGTVDSHNFIVSRELIGDTRWILDKYDADGFFAKECYNKTKSTIHIPKILSVYNSLK
jgi:hypothetical protein